MHLSNWLKETDILMLTSCSRCDEEKKTKLELIMFNTSTLEPKTWKTWLDDGIEGMLLCDHSQSSISPHFRWLKFTLKLVSPM